MYVFFSVEKSTNNSYIKFVWYLSLQPNTFSTNGSHKSQVYFVFSAE